MSRRKTKRKKYETQEYKNTQTYAQLDKFNNIITPKKGRDKGIEQIGIRNEKRKIYKTPDGYCVMYEVPQGKIGTVGKNKNKIIYSFNEYRLYKEEIKKCDEFKKLTDDQKNSIPKFSDITKPKENIVNGPVLNNVPEIHDNKVTDPNPPELGASVPEIDDNKVTDPTKLDASDNITIKGPTNFDPYSVCTTGGKHKKQTRKIKQTYLTRKRNKKY